jgi:hypothetical protein
LSVSCGSGFAAVGFGSLAVEGATPPSSRRYFRSAAARVDCGPESCALHDLDELRFERTFSCVLGHQYVEHAAVRPTRRWQPSHLPVSASQR